MSHCPTKTPLYLAEWPVIMTIDPGGGSTVELDRLSNSKVAALRFRNGCSSGNFLGRRNHRLPKESQHFINTSYRYLPFDRASGALANALLCWQDDHDHSRWRPRWLGRISIQSSDAVFEEVHTGQLYYHDGVHGRRLGEKGGELPLYRETRWAQDRFRRRDDSWTHSWLAGKQLRYR